MKPNKCILILSILLLSLNVHGQKKRDKLLNNPKFEWVVDSISTDLILYYEKNSFSEKNVEVLKLNIAQQLRSTLNFIGVEVFDKPIHYFIVENRDKMKLLVGYTTNGTANPKDNYITGIFSSNIKSVYANHELFHLIAMNLWGYPETWINEGMAVYSDNGWNGYNLHEISKYLIDKNKVVSLNRMLKSLRKYDSMITYPLLGSFIKFIDEPYGREIILKIWKKGRRGLKKHLGKSLNDLENEWLLMLNSLTYKDIQYLQ